MSRGVSDRSDAIDPYLPQRGNAGYVVTGYDLELDYAMSSNRLDGRALITAEALDELPRLTLDLVGLRATKVAVDGVSARWSQRAGKLHLTAVSPISAGAAFAVDVRYTGNPGPARSTWGLVGWEELSDGVLVAGQPCGAPTWFPCNDLARQKAPFRVSVTAASSYRVVANGRLVSTRARGNRTTWVYEQAEPTSPYLATLHLGRYEQRELPGSPIPMRTLAPPELRREVARAFADQGEMAQTFIDWFGPYPFEAGYAVVVSSDELEVPLEAQGQSVFGTNHLSDQSNRLVAHELAHQWFGNSLTAASWQDIWLHEGFACYAEWLWSEAAGGPSADALATFHHDRLGTLPQDLVLGDPGPRDLFDDRVYKRGALALHALRGALGDTVFRRLLHKWASTYQHGVVTTEAFVAMAEQVGKQPLEGLFRAWLWDAALPPLTR